MEGRPPYEPEDELDFDFDRSRRDYEEGGTGERRAAEPPRYGEEPKDSPSQEYPSEEYPSDETDDPFAAERSARRERPRPRGLGALTRIALGRRYPRDRRGRRIAPEQQRDRPDTAEGRPRDVDTAEWEAAGPDTRERMLRDDPYTPSEGPAPAIRRSRRRDLPAKVRRRQTFGLAAIAALLLLGGYLAFAGGGGDEEEPLAVEKLVGQSFVGVLNDQGVTPQLLRKVRRGELGGIIANVGNENLLQAAVEQLQQAAAERGNPPLLIMVDQEGPPVNRLPGPPDLGPEELGRSGDPEVVSREAEKAGTYLSGLGVNVDLAPVLDVRLNRTAETIAERTYGEDAAQVAELGSAFIVGLQQQGVAATAKHFPGLGPATLNTDFAAVSIAARQSELDAALQPFQSAIEAGVDLVMMSSAAYPAYAGASPGEGRVLPAVFARPIVQGMLREQLGFEGVVISDDLESIAIQDLSNPAIAAPTALGVGVDMVVYARSIRNANRGFNRVVGAVNEGRIDRASMERSYERITRLKAELAIR